MTPEWVDHDLVPDVHEDQIEQHGGALGLRDAGALSSALARPEQLFAYAETPPTLFALAAAYAFGLARNHPFVDGNKRTSLVVTAVFLRLNGYVLTASTAEKVETWLALAGGSMDEASMAGWLERHASPVTST